MYPDTTNKTYQGCSTSKLALIGHTGFKLEDKNIDYNDNKDEYTPWLSVVLFGNPGTKRCVCRVLISGEL